MRNLLLIFARFYHFFLFLLLELICFFLVVNNQHFHSARFFDMTSEVSGSVYQGYDAVVEYFRLSRVNDSLQAENALLREHLKSSYYVEQASQDTISDSMLNQKYLYIPAQVINNSVTERNNYLTLDKGSSHGVEKRMGVISSNGIVGIVKNVSPHFSSVISVLHKDFRVSARIVSNRQVGALVWNGSNPDQAILKDVPNYANIEVGQNVVTSQYSAIFPENIPIGTISDYSLKEGDNFYTIYVDLGTDFRNISVVYVIDNIMLEEQEELEEASEE